MSKRIPVTFRLPQNVYVCTAYLKETCVKFNNNLKEHSIVLEVRPFLTKIENGEDFLVYFTKNSSSTSS